MAKLTLIDIVQDVLSDMGSDEVNSISDIVESLQVAYIVKSVFLNIINKRMWPNEAVLTSLTPASDTNKPTHFTIPDNVVKVAWIKYDNRSSSSSTKVEFEDITYLQPKDFLDYCLARDSTASTTQTVTVGDYTILIKTDTNPTYYTTFDDENIIFDSFDNSIDTTLQESKIMAYCEVEPTWSMADTYTPDLPSHAFSYLVSEVKSMAFTKIKQAASPKDEQESRSQKNYLSSAKWKVGGGIKYPNFGR